MKRRFQPREALLFYAVAFGCALAFFLLGVYAGRSFFPAPAPPVVARQDGAEAGESAKPDLNFYNDMVAPDRETSGDDSSRRTGSHQDVANRPQPSVAVPFDDGKPPKQPSGEKPQPAAPAKRRFVTVQVGALNTMEEARQVMIRLQAKGYLGRLVEPTFEGDFYRVWVGEFPTESEARSLEAQLKSDDFHTYIKTVEEPAGSN